MIVYVATTNSGKLRDFAESGEAEGVELRPLPDLASMPEPIEDAPDFMGNAVLKAVAYSRLATDLLVLADDSGLAVDALGGQPGVRSARFADDLGYEVGSALSKDRRNNHCLLTLLRQANHGTSTASRRAHFRCALALARNGDVLLNAEGSCEGEILPDGEPTRGENGFGYDPLFLVPDLGRTMAELTRQEKWQRSHRGSAFRSLLLQLRGAKFQSGKDIAQPGR